MRVDGVTLADLHVLRESDGSGGLIGMFEPTESRAGRAALRRRLTTPDSDPEKIQEVQDAVRFFAEGWRMEPLPPGCLDSASRYMASNIDLGGGGKLHRDLLNSIWLPIWEPDLCRELRDGVATCLELLESSASIARSMLESRPPELLARLCEEVLEIHGSVPRVGESVGLLQAIRLDRHFRRGGRAQLKQLIDHLAQLDALRSMGVTTRDRRWAFPELVGGSRVVLEGDGIYHPFVANPEGNPVRIAGGESVVFLTGPNMAGKTTYIRAVGLATLLAQAGMGVPATKLRLTPAEVLLTGLNPADNLRAGLSYFFAEVQRVKEAAEHLAMRRRCLVLFDEVFKGTNVKDALEASLSVISGFSKSRESGCIFSSHLTELAAPLAELGRVQFVHFEGRVVGGRATYSYRLRRGVSAQRFGLQLLDEADVPALLERIGGD